MRASGAVVVVIGPAGSGKTTVGRALAEPLGATFVDADDYHDAASVARMRRGAALGDDDRWPWLARLRDRVAAALASRERVVLACSALRRAYREALVPPDAPPGAVRFVYLHVGRATLAARLLARAEHYATASLLDSQLATLEVPNAEERVPTIDGERAVTDIVTDTLAALSSHSA